MPPPSWPHGDLDSFRIQETFEDGIPLKHENVTLPPVTTDVRPGVKEPEKAYLSDIIHVLNETYGLDFTEKDRVRVEEIVREVESDEGVRAVMTGNNSMSNKRHKVHKVIDDRMLDQVHHSIELYKKLNDPQVKQTLKDRLFEKLVTQFDGRAS